MNSKSFLFNYIQEFLYDYIKELYLKEFKRNDDKHLEEFQISMFIEDNYLEHKPKIMEILKQQIETNYNNLFENYISISSEIFNDDDYNKGILFEKICIYKLL